MTEPQRENAASEKTNPGLTPIYDPGATQALKISPALTAPPAAPDVTPTVRLPLNPAFPEARPAAASPRRSRGLHWVIGILAVLMLGGSLGYYLLYPSGEAPAALQRTEETPAAVRPYLDKANQGDPGAMQMLGYMYYNGLNVAQDRKEGIRWFRKAASAGSAAARKELDQLGLSVSEK